MLDQYSPDCIILVETKLDENYSNSEFFDLNNWNVVVRKDRNIHGGGIIMAVLRKYTASPVNIEYNDQNEDPELYWIKLHSINNRKPVYICGFYRSQRDIRSKNTLNCLQESLAKLPGKRGKQHVVITADANLHIDWENNKPQMNSFTKALDEKMLEICDNFNLIQKVDFPTRLDNTLDILLTSDPAKIVNIYPADPLADHDGIVAEFDFCVKKKTKSQHKIYIWNKADTKGLCEHVNKKLNEQNFSNNIAVNWSNFKNILLYARDKFVPHRFTTTRYNLPWYHQNLRRLCNKKQRLYNKARKTKSKEDVKAFKACRAEYTRILKHAQRDYFSDFLDSKLDENGKYLFSYIKRLKKNQ